MYKYRYFHTIYFFLICWKWCGPNARRVLRNKLPPYTRWLTLVWVRIQLWWCMYSDEHLRMPSEMKNIFSEIHSYPHIEKTNHFHTDGNINCRRPITSKTMAWKYCVPANIVPWTNSERVWCDLGLCNNQPFKLAGNQNDEYGGGGGDGGMVDISSMHLTLFCSVIESHSRCNRLSKLCRGRCIRDDTLLFYEKFKIIPRKTESNYQQRKKKETTKLT